MLSNEQKAAVEENPITVDHGYHYERFDFNGEREGEMTLTCHFGKPVTIIGRVQTLDELEVAVARLIEKARKEVSHGKVVQPSKELAWK